MPADPDDAIPIHKVAQLIAGDYAIGIAVKSKAHIRGAFHYKLLQRLRMCGAATRVDVIPIRFITPGDNFCPKRSEYIRSNTCRCAICAVKRNAHAIKAGFRCAAQKSLIFLHRAARCDHMSYANARWARKLNLFTDQTFDLIFQSVGEFEAIPVEPLDAVILHGVMRSTDHHCRIRLIEAHQISHRRGWDYAHMEYIPTNGTNACRKGSRQHVAAPARIHANKNARIVHLTRKHIRACRTDLHCKRTRKISVCNTAHAVGSKKSRHVVLRKFIRAMYPVA